MWADQLKALQYLNDAGTATPLQIGRHLHGEEAKGQALRQSAFYMMRNFRNRGLADCQSSGGKEHDREWFLTDEGKKFLREQEQKAST